MTAGSLRKATALRLVRDTAAKLPAPLVGPMFLPLRAADLHARTVTERPSPGPTTRPVGGPESGARRSPEPRPAAPAAESPVFVDASGRRARRLRALLLTVCAFCVVYLGLLTYTLLLGLSAERSPTLPTPHHPVAEVPDGAVTLR